MQSSQRQRWPWKTWWLCWCMIISPGQGWGQTFAEALQAGRTIKVEWIRQELGETNGAASRNIPLFPDELHPGESEIRVGLHLKSAEDDGRLVAEVAYVNFLSLPELKENPYRSNTGDMLSHPIILDTRFQDRYFNPLLFLLDALTQQTLPVSCRSGPYQQFLNQFDQVVEQSGATAPLITEQLEWLKETALPASLSASSMADFFCRLLEKTVPKQESPVKIQSRSRGDGYRVDYVQVDHPARICVLKGNIQSPATEEVRVQFFREGNWLEYWRDSLIQLDGKGNFYLAFPLDHPRTVALLHGYQTMRFYIEPGDTLQVRTNANAFYREMQIAGAARAENEFLLDFYHEMRGDTFYRRMDVDLLKKDHLAFFKTARAKEARELAFLSQRTPSLRPGFTALMDRVLKLEHAGAQWEAAYLFMAGKGVLLEPELLHRLQKTAALLYRLPRGKSFDFDVEDYLSFQFHLLHHTYQMPGFGAQEDLALAQLLPSKETFVRHTLMQLFRSYTELGQLTESGQWQLSQLLSVTRDTQLIQEMTVFMQGDRKLPPDVVYRILQKGEAAPSWRFMDKEGVKVGLEDFAGKKLLLHIGWADNLDIAMTDIQSLQESQEQLPEIVHLLAASGKDQFARSIAGKKGLFVYVPPEKMEVLKERYRIDNRSNHYYIIGEDGKIMANHYDLNTAKKLRGAWEKIAEVPAAAAWTPEQRLQFWQSLGIGALFMLLISGGILWQRRIMARRDLRRRQLLETELRGIRSQMNPHFLFNAMSSIQNLVRKKEQEKADLYLGQFAGLMRKTLRNTSEEYIPLIDEIETLEQYCSLESLRHPFQYEFRVDERIDAHNTYIPSMILQPIIENAIIHGLAPQSGSGALLVEIGPGREGLNCTVTDNGIGVLATQKHPERNNHQSVGMKLIRQRLELMGLKGREHLSVTDRSTLSPPAQGTLVSITIPVEQ